jgi:hypothetical protein
VLGILERHGVKRRNQPLTAEQCETAIQLYQQGRSLARIGREFGKAHTVVRDVLIRAGMPRHGPHERLH